MTANELNRQFLKELASIYNRHEAANITSMVLEHMAGINKSALIREPEQPVAEEIKNKLFESLVLLKKNMPVQYVLGEAWFYHLKFKVTPAVLIPRPETEELVTEVIQAANKKNGAVILDIGTGSGCIPIAIKKNVPHCNITAIDSSSEALMIAKENAKNNEAEIDFEKIDFLSTAVNNLPAFDIIVSNPPYIPLREIKKMDKNVTEYEPHKALFVNNEQPFIFYEHIACFAKDHLKEKGSICLETHEDYAQEVLALFPSEQYAGVIKKDIFGKERMVIINRIR